VSISGIGVVPGAFNTVDVISGDLQQLRFNVSGPTVPEFIDVDITFSISASVNDNTTGTTAFYFPYASGGVEVLEASTVDLNALSVLAAFSAIASISDGEKSLINSTDTISVRPNADYWVRLITQANITFNDGDFTGLDVEINGYADPTFALNPLFAAANPDIAAALVIEQVSIVPLPAAGLLFAPAMFGLALWSRRKKRI